MKFKKIALIGLAAIFGAGASGWQSLDKETRGFLAAFPTNTDLLFWSTSQRDAAFRALDRLPFLAKHRVVPAGDTASALPPGAPLALPLDIDAYMQGQRSAALMVLHNGQVRLERYGLDFDSEGRWTSFSVAKSLTSTLVGMAVRDGHIQSMDDKVSDYIAEMKGSAYDDGSFAARGIFGQGIFIDPARKLVIASNANWGNNATDPTATAAREAFYVAVQQAVDAEVAEAAAKRY